MTTQPVIQFCRDVLKTQRSILLSLLSVSASLRESKRPDFSLNECNYLEFLSRMAAWAAASLATGTR